MKFNEKLALELIQRHKLAQTTLRVWKNRGEIPDKYADPNYTPPKPASTAQQAAAKRVIDVKGIFWGLLNKPSRQTIQDFLRGNTQLHDDDYRALIEATTDLRNRLRKFAAAPTEANFKALIKDKRIQEHVIFDSRILARMKLTGHVSASELRQESIKAAALAAAIKLE